jgi:hypothetical protein
VLQHFEDLDNYEECQDIITAIHKYEESLNVKLFTVINEENIKIVRDSFEIEQLTNEDVVNTYKYYADVILREMNVRTIIMGSVNKFENVECDINVYTDFKIGPPTDMQITMIDSSEREYIADFVLEQGWEVNDINETITLLVDQCPNDVVYLKADIKGLLTTN